MELELHFKHEPSKTDKNGGYSIRTLKVDGLDQEQIISKIEELRKEVTIEGESMAQLTLAKVHEDV